VLKAKRRLFLADEGLTFGGLDDFAADGKNSSSNDRRVDANDDVYAVGASIQLQNTQSQSFTVRLDLTDLLLRPYIVLDKGHPSFQAVSHSTIGNFTNLICSSLESLKDGLWMTLNAVRSRSSEHLHGRRWLQLSSQYLLDNSQMLADVGTLTDDVIWRPDVLVAQRLGRRTFDRWFDSRPGRNQGT